MGRSKMGPTFGCPKKQRADLQLYKDQAFKIMHCLRWLTVALAGSEAGTTRSPFVLTSDAVQWRTQRPSYLV